MPGKYTNTNMVTAAVSKKAAVAPSRNHINPVSELAGIAQILCKPENVPIAVAVSFLSVILLIQAFEIPSAAAAYKP